jgi:Uroporphyrinogen-III decarboxylase
VASEQFLSVLKCGTADHVPIFLRDLTLAMDAVNVKTTEVFTEQYNAELSAHAVVSFQKMTGQDAVVGCIQSAAFNVESFGGVMKYPEYGIPVPLTHPLQGVTELPEVPAISGRTAGAVRSYSLVREMLPDTAVVGNVEGPFTKTGVLMGMDDLALMMISERDHVNEVIRLTTEHTMSFIEELDRNSSIDCVFLASASDNPDLFGCEVYQNIVVPNVKDITSRAHKLGYPVIFHPHGVFLRDCMHEPFEDTLRTGIDGIQFSEGNDPKEITSMINGRCSVLGGTDIVPTLISGTDEDIKERTEYYLEGCSSGSHIFMPSCSLHRGTSIHRVMKMIEVVRNYVKV